MKAQRLNLCTVVRNSILLAGYSSVKVVNAVNAALGALEAHSEEGKLGDGRVTKSEYKVTETVTLKYKGDKATAPLLFDAWHSAIAKAEKIASFESLVLPGVFIQWLDKFAKADKSEAKSAEVPAPAAK